MADDKEYVANRLESGDTITMTMDPIGQDFYFQDQEGNTYRTKVKGLNNQDINPVDCPECGPVTANYDGDTVACTKCELLIRCAHCLDRSGEKFDECSNCGSPWDEKPLLIVREVVE